MHIHSLAIEEVRQGTWRISAKIADEFGWYEIEGAPGELRRSYDPFVLAGLFTAMDKGIDITVEGDAPVSAPLIRNVERVAHIASEWWPYLAGGKVRAAEVEKEPEPGAGFVGSFFSGGADSLFTYAQNADEITHFILCRGLDIADHEDERWARTRNHISDFAQHTGKALILVRTNLRSLLPVVGKANNHGALLASTGLPMGFEKLLIPATNPIHRLQPHGSHPFLDPWFANGCSTVVHDSPIRRSEKLEAIARSGEGLQFLRVCNRESDYNCGTCEKCLRTRAALAMVDAESQALEPMSSPAELRGLTLHKALEYDYWVDNLDLAIRVGREDYVSAIRKLLRNWRTRETIRQLDADWFGGRVIKFKRALLQRR